MPKINTVSGNGEGEVFSINLSYYTNKKIKEENYENYAKIIDKSHTLNIDEQDIDLVDSGRGFYKYVLTIDIDAGRRDTKYDLEINLDKKYTLKNLTNKVLAQNEENDIVRGYTSVIDADSNMPVNVIFEKGTDINKIKVDDVLGNVTDNKKGEDAEDGQVSIDASLKDMSPQIIGIIYTVDGKTYPVDNVTIFKNYTKEEVNKRFNSNN